MASPYVAALAAIIKGYYQDTQSKTLTPAEIRRLINASSNRSTFWYYNFQYGNGVIDAKNALFMAGASSIDNSTSSEIGMGSFGLFSELVCYPNPLNISHDTITTCSYYLNKSAYVSYVIVSRRGQVVKRSSNS